MATSKAFAEMTLTLTTCLSNASRGGGDVHKAVALASPDITAVASGAAGILQTAVDCGRSAPVAWQGEFKYTAAEAIGVGEKLTLVTSGYMKPAVRGEFVVGRNAELSVASGALGRGQFDFSAPWEYQTNNFADAPAADLTVANAVGKAYQSSSGDFATAAGFADGIVLVGATSGQPAVIGAMGTMNYIPGNVIGAGHSVKVANSGYILSANSGDKIVGRAIDAIAAADCGTQNLGSFNFANVTYAVECFAVHYF